MGLLSCRRSDRGKNISSRLRVGHSGADPSCDASRLSFPMSSLELRRLAGRLNQTHSNAVSVHFVPRVPRTRFDSAAAAGTMRRADPRYQKRKKENVRQLTGASRKCCGGAGRATLRGTLPREEARLLAKRRRRRSSAALRPRAHTPLPGAAPPPGPAVRDTALCCGPAPVGDAVGQYRAAHRRYACGPYLAPGAYA
eukprot:926277-Rhodomonas_salina.1